MKTLNSSRLSNNGKSYVKPPTVLRVEYIKISNVNIKTYIVKECNKFYNSNNDNNNVSNIDHNNEISKINTVKKHVTREKHVYIYY